MIPMIIFTELVGQVVAPRVVVKHFCSWWSTNLDSSGSWNSRKLSLMSLSSPSTSLQTFRSSLWSWSTRTTTWTLRQKTGTAVTCNHTLHTANETFSTSTNLTWRLLLSPLVWVLLHESISRLKQVENQPANTSLGISWAQRLTRVSTRQVTMLKISLTAHKLCTDRVVLLFN